MKTLILFIFLALFIFMGKSLTGETSNKEELSMIMDCDYKYEIICEDDYEPVCWLYTYCDDRLVSVEVIDPH